MKKKIVELKVKRLFFVLNDFWSENYEEWKKLKNFDSLVVPNVTYRGEYGKF